MPKGSIIPEASLNIPTGFKIPIAAAASAADKFQYLFTIRKRKTMLKDPDSAESKRKLTILVDPVRVIIIAPIKGWANPQKNSIPLRSHKRRNPCLKPMD